ncbi:50S ribosomal protein L29 [Myxococcota bacterium]|nr:50S ribosomal protein L29 [Myxococcota bacterium]MBU1382624.1 50S ribosomal protein L29 [Myxococcota bacterium]MBU1495841.1 50S ribosomal protein L29 [Myxococcota bacterium]
MKDSPYASSQLRQRSLEELRGLLAELKKEKFDLRIMAATSQLKDNNKIAANRRNIARVLTEMTDKKISRRRQENE